MIGPTQVEAPQPQKVVHIKPGIPSPISLLQVMPHIDPCYGGISTVVPELSSRLHKSDQFSVQIAAFCGDAESDERVSAAKLGVTRWPSSRVAWAGGYSLRARFRSLLRSSDIIHIHGLWDVSSFVAARMSRSLDRPYVLSAHGMLEPWAFANKGLKKRIYSAVVERTNAQGAACLHALTQAEALDYRRFGIRTPIAIIPNGVQAPESVSPSEFLKAFPQLYERRIILFLGRLHPKKGLDLLLEAWSQLAAEHPDAVLVLAGPNSNSFQSVMESRKAFDMVRDQVLFTGMLGDELKWSALSSATLFVLPSYSEGFSMAILEAMRLAVPVIITTSCNLPEVQAFGAGWQIRPQALELFAALQDALSNSPAKNADIGAQGQRLVEERYSWSAVAEQMGDLYRYILGGCRPRSFQLLEALHEF